MKWWDWMFIWLQSLKWNEASSEDLKHKQKQSIKQAIPVLMYASMEYTYSHLENYW